MHAINLFRPTLLTLALSLAGCSLAPTYERPVSPVAETWSAPASFQLAPELADWRNFVVDPTLRKRVVTSLVNNRNLRQALLNIEAARAQYRVQRADRLPTLNVTANGSRQRTPADLSQTGSSEITHSYHVGLGLTEFEIDLFGRVHNLSEAALETYLATGEATRATQISLIAEVVQASLTLEGAQRRLALVNQTLESREASLDLVRQRRQAGTATALDYQEALGLTEQTRADRESTDRQLRQAANALDLLMGQGNSARSLVANPVQKVQLVQDLAPGTSSTLLERRPDILASEHRLKARYADIGAARAAFFPRISLTGAFGSSSAELSGLFDGGSRGWSFAPTLSLPIFDASRNSANLELAEVRRDSAIANYEGTIQTAFREVADALAATDTLRREEVARQKLADSSNEALKLAKARYEVGVDNHLRYLDAQRTAFNDQTTLIKINTERQLALANLYKALGGGWSERF